MSHLSFFKNLRIHIFFFFMLPTNASAGVAWRVGVALVTMAAEGAVRVLTEAVVTTYGVVGALIDIWESNERGEAIRTDTAAAADTRRTPPSWKPLSDRAKRCQTLHIYTLQCITRSF